MSGRRPINGGVFSRIYRWPDNIVSVAYHTPSRSATILEGDSAEVWWAIYEAVGDTHQALAYMLAHGDFGDDAEAEAAHTLDQFLLSLEESNLIVGGGNRPASTSPTTSIEDTVNPGSNPEQQIGQIMADRHVCYSLVLETTYRCNEKCVHCYMSAYN